MVRHNLAYVHFSSTGEGSTSGKLQPELLSLHLDYGSNGHLFKLYTLKVENTNPKLVYMWILAPMGSSQFLEAIHTWSFLIKAQWDTLSSSQDISNTTQALMNTKVHSIICKCNECTHKLSLRTNTQEKRWLRASVLFCKWSPTLYL